jgi:hypothetical protein
MSFLTRPTKQVRKCWIETCDGLQDLDIFQGERTDFLVGPALIGSGEEPLRGRDVDVELLLLACVIHTPVDVEAVEEVTVVVVNAIRSGEYWRRTIDFIQIKVWSMFKFVQDVYRTVIC